MQALPEDRRVYHRWSEEIATEVLAPTNANGDLEGCTLAEGEVRTPRGYKEAYRAFVEAGWPALACSTPSRSARGGC